MATKGWFCQDQLDASVTRIWEPDVHRFFQANIWLVRGRAADLVIDFGMGLAPLAPVLGRTDARPVKAVATHCHVDHVGSFHEFEVRLGHPLEAKTFAAMDDDHTLAHLFRQLNYPVSRLPQANWDKRSFELRTAPLTDTIEEGDSVNLGDMHFQVLHLPGHSPGSVGLWEPRRRILFSGDAIYSGTLVDDVPGADIDSYMNTMRRLEALDVDVVFPGHNAPISGEEMRAIAAQYLKDKGA